ncbi:MAG: hypothetical protein CML46_13175 [Rhodobacteraceae bacterium]|nr:hypothetical protein [Paracoccaceae bacterium]MBR27881.1 hypothetical protein [Paracoccaceae bacterium]
MDKAAAIQGDPSSPPPGCDCAGRQPHAVDRCRTGIPAPRDMGGGQAVACLRADGTGGFV